MNYQLNLSILAILSISFNIFGQPDSLIKKDSLPETVYNFKTINFSQGFWMKTYYLDDKPISRYEAQKIIFSCDSSRSLMKNGTALILLSHVCMVAGVVTVLLASTANINNYGKSSINFTGIGIGLPLELISYFIKKKGESMYSNSFDAFFAYCLHKS